MTYSLLLAALLCVGLAIIAYLFFRTVLPIARLRFRWTYYSDDFRIATEILETLVYWEGDDGFAFDSAWGLSPFVTYVPAPDVWDAVVPAWMAGRRAEIVDRLRKHSHQTVKESERGYSPDQPWRLRSPATEAAKAAAARELRKSTGVRLLFVKLAALCIAAIVVCIALWLVAPAALVGGIVGATAAAILSYRRRRRGRIVPGKTSWHR
jgi:hypothetical protein